MHELRHQDGDNRLLVLARNEAACLSLHCLNGVLKAQGEIQFNKLKVQTGAILEALLRTMVLLRLDYFRNHQLRMVERLNACEVGEPLLAGNNAMLL